MDLVTHGSFTASQPRPDVSRLHSRPHHHLQQRANAAHISAAKQFARAAVPLHGPAAVGPHARRGQASVVARAGKSTTSGPDSGLRPGDLVEFIKDRERSSLGLVQEPDGKKNVWVLDSQSMRRVSIVPSRQVVFKLPGGPFTESQLQEFAAAAAADEATASGSSSGGSAAAARSAVLADAWEMAVADHISSLSLTDLAGLVLEDEAPCNLYRMFRILSADRLYFKQLSGKAVAALDVPLYEPRSPQAVEAQREALVREALVREDESQWAAAVRAALATRRRSDQPSPEDWASGRHAKRIAALKELATLDVGPLAPTTLSLAQQSLALAGIVPPSASAPAQPGGSDASPLSEAATNLLVDIRAWRRHEPVAALRRAVPMSFPPSLEAEAQALLEHPPPDSCASVRVDLTHLPCFTIDDEGTREIDDGLSIEFLDAPPALAELHGEALQGSQQAWLPSVRLWVHVADPTRWLSPRGTLVDAARTRTRTLYFPWGSVPMFPRALAEGPFSLRQGHVCDALSVGVTLRPDGSLGTPQVVASRIKVSHQLTYDQADTFINTLLSAASTSAQDAATSSDASSQGSSSSSGSAASSTQGAQPGALSVEQQLLLLRRAADARRGYRERAGCIEIPLPECKVHVPYNQLDSGRPGVGLKRISQWDSPSRGMVAELMIVAGEAIGSIGAQAGLPLPFRGQPAPNLPPQAELQAMAQWPAVCMGYRLRRCMTRSGVGSKPMRHASLGLDAYVQATSPIRRWADIVAHFNLKAWVAGQPLPFSAADVEALNTLNASDRVREHGAAERAEEQYWTTEYFRQRQAGSGRGGASAQQQQLWPATVLGWQREELRLASVLLDELGLEVVVKVDQDVRPGDFVQLALLEARPVANVLRFYVAEHLPVGWGEEEEELEGEPLTPEEVFEQMEAARRLREEQEAAAVSDDSSSSSAATVSDVEEVAGMADSASEAGSVDSGRELVLTP